MALTAMYLLGFLAVREVLSTMCEGQFCTLRQQIRHTDAGEEVISWPGPPIGSADRLRLDQVEEIKTLGLRLDQYGWLAALQMGIPALLYLLIAAALFWQKSDDWMVLFVSVMVATFPLQDMPLPFTLVVRQPVWEWVFDPANWVAMSSILIFPLIFPTGRFVPRWTRWMALFDMAGAAIIMLFRNAILEIPGAANLVVVYILIAFGTGVYAQLYRYFRVASPAERQQLKWVIVGLAGFISIAVAVLLPLDALLASPAVSADPARALVLSVIPDTLFRAVSLFIPVSITISVLRYRLWDIDVVINRSLVYGALTAIVVGLYVLLVGILGALFQTRSSPPLAILATGLVALLFQPLRLRLQRAVNRLMYGERDDPYAVLSRLGQRLEASLAPDAVLPTVVETVKDALKLPYVAIALEQDDVFSVAASAGEPVDNPLILPLVYQHETVGQLLLGPRTPGEFFSSTDRRLLDDLARQAGVAAHAVRLTADLLRSRERLVAAREEERRRIRRDLHDGLGPALATQALRLEAARDLVDRDPPQAVALLSDLIGESQAALADIRRLVYALRPPALDELGLIPAIQEKIAHYESKGISITLDAPERLPPLPAAVEVAVYRIVQEALTNIARHAQARTCHVQVAINGGLQVVIADDGVGLPRRYLAGVGLTSMRERSEELGGSCVVERAPHGGTRVVALLPLPEG